MGRDALEHYCEHYWQPMGDDDILMGYVIYGRECKHCHKQEYSPPGPLELGTYR